MKFHLTDGVQSGVFAVAPIPDSQPLRTEQILPAAAVEPPQTNAIPAVTTRYL